MFCGLFPFLLALTLWDSFGDGRAGNKWTDARDEQNSGSLFCGKTLARSRSRVRRIIGGHKASTHAWPWQVLILNYTSIYCSGSIISPTWLITAAHCVDQLKKTNLSFYVGKNHIYERESQENKLEIEEFHTHEKYRKGDDHNPGDYDMALLKTKKPIQFSDYVHPICLSDVERFKPGHECILSGWGTVNLTTKKTSESLREIKLPLVSRNVCNGKESYNGLIHRRYLCAGVAKGGKDGCTFDSGGPLMCRHGEAAPWYLTGLMIWGDGCAKPNKYGVYANVTEFMAFIKSKVKDLPRPFSPGSPSTRVQPPEDDTADTPTDKPKEKLFIAVIAGLCVFIVVLLTIMCINNFYRRGYICCTATDKTRHPKNASRLYHEQNGKLNKEVSV